jgi:hypothetical protein
MAAYPCSLAHRHMDLALGLEVFGCMMCARRWQARREARRTGRQGNSNVKVIDL